MGKAKVSHEAVTSLSGLTHRQADLVSHLAVGTRSMAGVCFVIDASGSDSGGTICLFAA